MSKNDASCSVSPLALSCEPPSLRLAWKGTWTRVLLLQVSWWTWMPCWGVSRCSELGCKLVFWTQVAPEQGPSVQPKASLLTSLSPRQVKQLQQAPWRPPFCTVLSPAGIGLSSPPKGTRGWRPPLSDETPAQGSLSLMKGSLCSTGRPLSKDKTAVCPLSLVWGWGPPLRLADGWGWVQVHSRLPLFPCLPAQPAPPPSSPTHLGSPCP